jgi:hypothetical protein
MGPGVLEGTRFRRGRRGYVEVLNLLTSIDYEKHVLRTDPEAKAMMGDGARIVKYIKSMCPRERINVIILTPASEKTINVIKNLSPLRNMGFSLNTFILIPQLYGLTKLSPFEVAVYRLKVYNDIKRAYDKARELRSNGIRTVIVTPWETPSRIMATLNPI